MKKLLTVLVPAAIVAGGGVAATYQYNNYQHKVATAHQVIVDQQATVLAAEQSAHAKVSAAYSALHLECEKGKAAYGALSTTLQKKIPAPTCGPVIAN